MKKVRAILCILFRHSNLFYGCFGYEYCARCGQQVGDSLGGVGSGGVPLAHAIKEPNCEKCIAEKRPSLTWWDWFALDPEWMGETTDRLAKKGSL